MSVLFLTGAGISANAGIATYRDGGSSWVNSDLEAKSHANRYGNHLDELWEKHWGPVSRTMTYARPTYAHQAIAAFQSRHVDKSIIVTQNIDDLHERAGSENIAHVHGDMTAKCIRCKGKNIGPWLGAGAPECLDCGSCKTRPDVVLFGEQLNKKMFLGIENFAKADCTHIVTVGTSLNVYPAAGIVIDTVDNPNVKVIIINKQSTTFDKWADVVINEDCDDVMDVVLKEIEDTL